MDINFKYEVWLSSLIGASDHRIEVFTETDRYEEFKQAVSKVASSNWVIDRYSISWEDAF